MLVKANFRFALSLLLCAWLSVPRGWAADVAKLDGQVFIRTEGGETIKLSLVEVDLFDAKVIENDLEKKREAAKPILEALSPLEKQLSAAADAANDTNARAQEANGSAQDAIAPAEDAKKDAQDKMSTDAADATFTSVTSNEAVSDQTAIDKASAALDQAKTDADNAKKAADNAKEAADQASKQSEDIRAALDYPKSTLYYFSELPKPLQLTKTDADGHFSFQVPRGSYVLIASSTRDAAKTEFYHWMVKVTVSSDQTVMLANDNLSSSGSPDSLIMTPDDELYIADAMQGKDIHTLADLVSQVTNAKRRQQLEEFRHDPQLAQKRAIQLYPDLGVAGSALNKEFIAKMKRYEIEKKDFFSEPDWPIRLAAECNEDLAAKKGAQ